MAFFTIDLTKDDESAMFPNGTCLGHIGEHNVNTLTIIPPNDMVELNPNYYRIDFGVGEWYDPEIVETQELTNVPFNIKITQDLSTSKKISFQITAYDENETIIAKSDVVKGLYFEESLVGDIKDVTGTFEDLGLEFKKFKKETEDYMASDIEERDFLETQIYDIHHDISDIQDDIAVNSANIKANSTAITNNSKKTNENTTSLRNIENRLSVEEDKTLTIVSDILTNSEKIKNVSDELHANYYTISEINSLNDEKSMELFDYSYYVSESVETSLFTPTEINQIYNHDIPMTWKGKPIIGSVFGKFSGTAFGKRNRTHIRLAYITADRALGEVKEITIWDTTTRDYSHANIADNSYIVPNSSRMLTPNEIDFINNIDNTYISNENVEKDYQKKITSDNKIPYSNISGTPDDLISELQNDSHIHNNKSALDRISSSTINKIENLEQNYYSKDELKDTIGAVENLPDNYYTKIEIDNALDSVELNYPNRVYELYSETKQININERVILSAYSAVDIFNIKNNGGVFTYQGNPVVSVSFSTVNSMQRAIFEYIMTNNNYISKAYVTEMTYLNNTYDVIYTQGASKYFFTDQQYSAIDNKQDKLVSGTNIKTINGQSILGSGNVLLASNIKSINNFSLNGTGNIHVASINNLPLVSPSSQYKYYISKINGQDIVSTNPDNDIIFKNEMSYDIVDFNDVLKVTIQANKINDTINDFANQLNMSGYFFALDNDYYEINGEKYYKLVDNYALDEVGPLSYFTNKFNLYATKILDIISLGNLENYIPWDHSHYCIPIKYVPDEGLYVYIPHVAKMARLNTNSELYSKEHITYMELGSGASADSIKYEQDKAETYKDDSIGKIIFDLSNKVDALCEQSDECEILLDVLLNGSTLVGHDEYGYYISDETPINNNAMEVEY